MTALAAYAAKAEHARRRHEEAPPRYRSEYQRDRDRILHCAAFRRLEYKTQVFVNHEGDLYRTRLTHSLEVAQIARSIARALGLSEDLTEAIALAHDLGHTPFGHAGQEALNDCMHPYGGFEHNRQSLRVVEELEQRYGAFDGLNLTFDTREGILKHCSRREAQSLGDLGRRFLERTQPSLEAQIANLSDEIAYNNHDVDDGLRAGLLETDRLCEIAIFADHHRAVRRRYPGLDQRRTVYETIRRMVDALVTDVIETSRANIDACAPADIAAVRARREALITFSQAVSERNRDLKRFLHRNLYHHFRVRRMASKAQQVVRELFEAFIADPRLLPPQAAERTAALESRDGDAGRARGIADYIAGMTDRFAINEHERLFVPSART